MFQTSSTANIGEHEGTLLQHNFTAYMTFADTRAVQALACMADLQPLFAAFSLAV